MTQEEKVKQIKEKVESLVNEAIELLEANYVKRKSSVI